MKDYKTKISVLISKTETDDKLIKALKQQLADMKVYISKMKIELNNIHFLRFL